VISRRRLAVRATLGRSTFKKNIKRIYFIKTVKYGKYKDVYDYAKVQVSFNAERVDFAKNKTTRKQKRTLYRIRSQVYRLIQANRGRHGKHKAVFITLTDREQETDIKKANRNIKAFVRRLKQHLGYAPRYIIVPERHKSGAVHHHGVFFNLPFIDVRLLKTDLWVKGYVEIQLPRKIKSVARYLIKYLTKDTLNVLPKNEKAYFTSRGLIRPSETFDDVYPDDTIKVIETHVNSKYIKQTYLCKN